MMHNRQQAVGFVLDQVALGYPPWPWGAGLARLCTPNAMPPLACAYAPPWEVPADLLRRGVIRYK